MIVDPDDHVQGGTIPDRRRHDDPPHPTIKIAPELFLPQELTGSPTRGSQPRSAQATPSGVAAALNPIRRPPTFEQILTFRRDLLPPTAMNAVEFQ